MIRPTRPLSDASRWRARRLHPLAPGSLRSGGLRCLAAVLSVASAAAQGPDHPTAAVTHTDTPPSIDGRLDDEVWKLAQSIGPLTQIVPIAGARPTEDTEVRLLLDERHLYIGIRCFDRSPGEIIGTQMARDAELDPDDRVEMVLDTFHDRRNAFYFQMSPVGSKGDALISNNGQDFNKPWDGIWEGQSSIDDQGWSVEMAIPFKTLSFNPSIDTWGFNINRAIKRRLETDRWSNASQDVRVFQIGEAGDITGLAGLHQGIGLDVVPFFHADWTNDRESGDQDLIGKPGLDVFYRITPSLQLSLTVNTDFAETEVDARQINLTRFPLFFPEKRSFFLQDSGIFQFADTGRSLIPFFSRRIGLDENGEEVPILYGGKLTGRAGDWNVGVLDVETDAQDTVPERNLFVTRISKNVGEQSTVGGIFTNGDPSSTDTSRTYGADYNFRTSSFSNEKNLNSSVWVLRTENESVSGDDLAFGASISYPNDLWSWRTSFKEIQENFDPRLGFVPRRGVRIWDAELGYSPRLDRAIRQLEYQAEVKVVTDLSDHVETAQGVLRPVGIVWDSGDELRFELKPSYESLDAPFEIEDGVIIPQDDYSYLRYRLELESALKRPVSGQIGVEVGDFFDGHRTDFEGEIAWRPSRFFTGALGYEQNRVDLDEGAFTTHLGSLRANVAFSPDLTWSTFVQFDNDSDTLGLNSRWRWIVKPGQEINLVFNQTLERRSGAIDPLFQEVAFKIAYTLRF